MSAPAATVPAHRVCAASLSLWLACTAGEPRPEPDAAPPPRLQSASAGLGQSVAGITDEIAFEVPAGSRSLTVTVVGDDEALFGLASLRLCGDELVGLDLSSPPGASMRHSYEDEEVGRMPGNLSQAVRLGTFSLVYPYAPGQSLCEGPGSLRVASSADGGSVDVELRFPEDDGAARLPLAIFDVASSFDASTAGPSVQAAASEILATAVQLDWVETRSVDLPELANLTEFSEPQEAPGSQAAMLSIAAQESLESMALPVVVVDTLPFRVAGLSLGTPGPPTPGSYYYGVVVAADGDASRMGRVIAHEVAHFVALQHVENRSLSGELISDPLEDTEPGQGNLMEDGVVVTPDQAYALSRSVLLVP